jgi:hypothetical protein
MSRLEHVDGTSWRAFLGAPVAVLVLGKTTCPACQDYARDLEAFLATETRWPQVRFGKMSLDEGGLVDFKRASPWLVDVDTLPFTQIYVAGERWKDFAGGGVERLQQRLERLPSGPGADQRQLS